MKIAGVYYIYGTETNVGECNEGRIVYLSPNQTK